MLQYFSPIPGLIAATILAATSVLTAQTPNLYWMNHEFDGDQSSCVDTALEGLRSGTMYNVTNGAKSDSGVRFATGANSNLNAVVSCAPGQKTVTTVIVAGSEGFLNDANLLGDYLSKYLLGERDGLPGLSSSEAPVKMNEWLTDEWCLGCEGLETEKRYSGEIVAPARSVRVRVQSGRAESGEGSVEVLMYDPKGQLVLTEQSNHKDWTEWRVGILNYGRYEIVLRSMNRSADTDATNEGEIQVLVR
jgi:hypothetical protein